MGNEEYAELHAHSSFTFLEGANEPASLVLQAAKLRLGAIAVLDVDGMYSAIQTARAGQKYQVPIVHGTAITLGGMDLRVSTGLQAAGTLNDGFFRPTGSFAEVSLQEGTGLPKGSEDLGLRLPLLARSPKGYSALCSLLSKHFLAEENRKAASFTLPEIKSVLAQSGQVVAMTGDQNGPLRRALASEGLRAGHAVIDQLKDTFGENNVLLEVALKPYDPPHLSTHLVELGRQHNIPIVATGTPRCATPQDKPLLDVLDAVRMGKPLDEAEPNLHAWPDFLRSRKEMLALHHRYPDAVDNAGQIAKDLTFNLSLIEPGLPDYPVPANHSESTWLRHLAYEGANRYYGSRAGNQDAWNLIDHELKIISDLGYPGYFLIVKDIVDYCRKQGILCQGRGSAANSAVCYALGITAVDAVKHKMLFERFLSPERSEAPDIDLDIEAKEREKVIQYVYRKYGRENAALVANVITYRPKSAVRDAGRALGYDEGHIRRWSKNMGWSRRTSPPTDSAVPWPVMAVAAKMQRLPRHMGIHPGGMVLTKTPVSAVCPVKWAAMPGRTVLQWDKEDCADAGLVKFDLLGLGMLTALRKCFNWLDKKGVTWQGYPLDLHNLPQEDPRVYDLLTAAETVGIFQVESRAQMNTLPRLKPRCFYDIVIEVALIRPGPIQGNAVNPYLRRKNGHEPVTYPHPLLIPALEKTLGVPIFQEQLMQIAVDAGGFSPGQADELRRAIGAKRSAERLEALKDPLFRGMTERGIGREAQEQIFTQLQGFAEFGFPESHAFSFAYLVYASSWLKVHHPELFYSALLSSQPMGFYSPASLIADARRLGVIVAPPSVVHSKVDTEPQEVPKATSIKEQDLPGRKIVEADPSLQVRLGLDTIKGIKAAADRIVKARELGEFNGLSDLAARAELSAADVEKLAAAGALSELGVSRRQGLWSAALVGNSDWSQPYLPGTEPAVSPEFPPMTTDEELHADFKSMGLSATRHPMASLRSSLTEKGIIPLSDLQQIDSGHQVKVAGLITHRQRPATAGGTTFLSLEDETDLANVICTSGLWLRYRSVALNSRAVVVRGSVENMDGAVALVANNLETLPIGVASKSRDFR